MGALDDSLPSMTWVWVIIAIGFALVIAALTG